MRKLIILLAAISILSCQQSVPKNVIPPAKMQAVLWDMMLADEMAGYYTLKDSTFRGLSKHADYYQKVLAVYKISKIDFTTSLSYYENNPGKLKTIFDSLQKSGERLRRADSLKITTPPAVVDSIIRKPSLPHKRP